MTDSDMATTRAAQGRPSRRPAHGTPGWVGRRVAVVAGCRTPFAKAGSVFRDMTAVQLGTLAVRELLSRAELDPLEVDELVYGTVVHAVTAPNIRAAGLDRRRRLLAAAIAA